MVDILPRLKSGEDVNFDIIDINWHEAGLQSSGRMLIKRCRENAANTPPAGTTHARPLTVTWLCHIFPALARCQPDGGLCFKLQPGRSPEHQTKERQQRQEHKASHAANLPYPSSGSLRRTERMGRKPRNGGTLAFGDEKINVTAA